jgi:hypothetical protein
MCECGGSCIRCQAAAHTKQVWDLVQRRILQTKIQGLERALRVEHRPAMAKRVRYEIETLKAQLG